MKFIKLFIFTIALLGTFLSVLHKGQVSAVYCNCYTGGCGGVPLEQPSFDSPTTASCLATGTTSCNPSRPGNKWGCFF